MTFAWNLETCPVVASTQDILKEKAFSGAPEGTAVQAIRQTAGRGRHGRVWESGEGNLALSVLLRPDCEALRAGELAFCPAVALAETMEGFCSSSAGVRLKWPNDVLIGEKKCAGILIESALKGTRVEWMALGIGVNIKAAPQGAAALQDFSREEISPDVFRDVFAARLRDTYGLWQKKGFAPVRESWLHYGHRKGDALLVKPGNEEVRGAFENIDAQGNLLLRQENGRIRKILSGDVFLV